MHSLLPALVWSQQQTRGCQIKHHRNSHQFGLICQVGRKTTHAAARTSPTALTREGRTMQISLATTHHPVHR